MPLPATTTVNQISAASGKNFRVRLVRPRSSLVDSLSFNQYSAEASRHLSVVKRRLVVGQNTTALHSFRHSVGTIFRNENPYLRESRIDAVLGHESGKCQEASALVSLKRAGAANLQRVVGVIRYPDAVQAAYRALIGLGHGQ